MKKTQIKENLVYLGIWVLLFLTPILSMMARMTINESQEFSWEEIIRTWHVFIPFLIVFIIHNYLVAPLLIYKKKKVLYLVITTLILTIFQFYSCNNKPKEPHFLGKAPDEMPRWEDGPRRGEFADSLPPPPKPDSLGMSPEEYRNRPLRFPPRLDGKEPGEAFDKPPLFMGQHDIIALIIMILLIGANLGVKLFFKSWKDNKTMEELEKKNLEQQLEYLKFQINPHFFMNTLNNIHALVSIDPEEAKQSIVELSKMMRYVLYEGDKGHVMLHQEIEFLNHYVTLMRLRYTDKVKIDITTPEKFTDKMVPPMILITFVENAFKHGVSYRKDSFIEVKISTTDDHMLFDCRNSKVQTESKEKGGVGLANARQRLDLIYGKDYKLETLDNADTYEVHLDIPFLTIENNLET